MFVRSLYAVKDIKSGFSDPCTQVNDAVAARSFERQIPAMSESLGIPLSDFQLWRVGKFDSDSGMLVPEAPELLLDGAAILRKDVISDEEPERSCPDFE